LVIGTVQDGPSEEDQGSEGSVHVTFSTDVLSAPSQEDFMALGQRLNSYRIGPGSSLLSPQRPIMNIVSSLWQC
jgi:hypothetical protein